LRADRSASRFSIELSSFIRPFVIDSTRSDDITMRMNFKGKADSVVAVGGRIRVRGERSLYSREHRAALLTRQIRARLGRIFIFNLGRGSLTTYLAVASRS
jgi:hypothetical protein